GGTRHCGLCPSRTATHLVLATWVAGTGVTRSGGGACRPSGQHRRDSGGDRIARPHARLVFEQRLEIVGLERPEQRNDLLGLEIVVVLNRRPRGSGRRLRDRLCGLWPMAYALGPQTSDLRPQTFRPQPFRLSNLPLHMRTPLEEVLYLALVLIRLL